MRILAAALVAASLAACGHHHTTCDAPRGTELALVVDNSDYMARVVEHAGMAPAAGVHAFFDRWHGPNGDTVTDVALAAPDRGALASYVATLPPVPPGHRIVYERVDGTAWRTVYIDTTPIFDGTAVAHAEPGDRGVTLDLTRDGARALARASGNAIGHKLAFVIGDEVVTAPILETAITGGKLVITQGPHDDGGASLLARLHCR